MGIKIPDFAMLNDKLPLKLCIGCGEGIFTIEFRTEASYQMYLATGLCLKCQRTFSE
jgi:hypothetical protein